MGLVGKLKGRSLDEVRVRAAQAGAALLERALGGHSVWSWMHSSDGLQQAARMFLEARPLVPGLQDPAATAALLAPAQRAAACAEAEAVLAGRYRLFGATEFDFGTPPRWHYEPRAGLETPRRHWSRIAYLDPAVAGDKKIVWELSRQQYLLTLGRAFASTRDERYAGAVLDHIHDWIGGNANKRGINWASSLEVAYRAIAWVWALSMVRFSRTVTPAALHRPLAALRLAGQHVETYLSTYFSPNTHLTGEALALYSLGLALPFLPDAPRWRKRGRGILLACLGRQVRPDGTYFENATYYHRYTLDIFVHLAVLADAAGDPLDPSSLATIEGLADALAAQIKPDGTHGYFGDDDGGRLLPLGEEKPNDFRPALSNAAVLFGRADLKGCAATLAEETVWLFGADAPPRFAALPGSPRPGASRALPDGGLFVMRDGGEADANLLVVDCGPHGAMNCGHAHADVLAFEVTARGRSVLMDAGTYTYTGDAAARQAFRSTAYHNALTVDGVSSSEPAGPFSWASTAQAHLNAWWSGRTFDLFDGSHDGFERLPDPVRVRREILFIKHGYWILRDRARGAAPHRFAQHFHVAPDLVALAGADGVSCRPVSGGPAALELTSFAEGGSWSVEDGWISTRYTDRLPAKTAVFAVTDRASTDIVSFMVPGDAATRFAPPARAPARAGWAFVRQGGGGSDLFAGGEGCRIDAGDVTAEAEWLWLRSRGGRPSALIARGARAVTLHDRPVVRADQPVDIAIWADGDLVEIDLRGDAAVIHTGLFGCRCVVVGDRRFTTGPDCILRFAQGHPSIL